MKSLALTRPGRVRSTRWVTRARGCCPYCVGLLAAWPPPVRARARRPWPAARAVPETSGGTGVGMMMPGPTGPIPGARACQIQLTELALYQAVKVPLYQPGSRGRRRSTPRSSRGGGPGPAAFFSLAGGSPGGVRATLVLQSGSDATAASTQDLQVDLDSVDSNLVTTVNWDVSGRDLRADTTARVELELGSSCPGGGRSQIPAGGDRWPSAPRPPASLKVVLVPVRYDADQSGRLPDVTEAQLQRYQDILMAYYPTRAVELTVHETVSTSHLRWPPTAAGPRSWTRLRNLRAQDGVAARRLLLRPGLAGDVVPDLLPRHLHRRPVVPGRRPPRSAARQVGAGVGFAGTLAGETLVHEIGHQHGRAHTPCGGGAGPDPRFPYSDGGIGVWGFDFRNMRLRAPAGPPESAAHKDFMGYCSPQWISDYTFAALATRRAAVSGVAASLREGGEVAVSGPSTRALPAGETRQVLLLGEDDAAQWGQPAGGAEAPAGHPVTAQVLDAAGPGRRPGHGLPDRLWPRRWRQPGAANPAGRLGRAGSYRMPTAPPAPSGSDRVAAAVPSLAPVEPGRPSPGKSRARWVSGAAAADPVGLTLAFRFQRPTRRRKQAARKNGASRRLKNGHYRPHVRIASRQWFSMARRRWREAAPGSCRQSVSARAARCRRIRRCRRPGRCPRTAASRWPTTIDAVAAPAQPFRNTLTGALGPYSLPSAPAYPSTMTGNYRPLPPMRPLETLARRGRPRWGLRFLMLLIVAGGATYFLRPYISWIDNRVTPVENRLREVAAQYGLRVTWLARVLPDRKATPAPVAVAPAAPAAPVAVAVERATAAPAPKAAAAGREGAGRAPRHRADLAARGPWGRRPLAAAGYPPGRRR